MSAEGTAMGKDKEHVNVGGPPTVFAENMRFYGDMRFKQLSLFLAAMTAAGGGIAQLSAYRWWIALAALYVTAVLWVMETRSSLYGIANGKAAAGFWPRPQRMLFPWLSATLVVFFLYVGFYAFWLRCIWAWYRCSFTFCVGSVVGLLLFMYSCVNYWRQRDFWLER